MLDIPYVGVSAALYLGFGLVDGLAEAVVDFLVNAVLGFVPDQIWDTVDRRLKLLAGQPIILVCLAVLLPF